MKYKLWTADLEPIKQEKEQTWIRESPKFLSSQLTPRWNLVRKKKKKNARARRPLCCWSRHSAKASQKSKLQEEGRSLVFQEGPLKIPAEFSQLQQSYQAPPARSTPTVTQTIREGPLLPASLPPLLLHMLFSSNYNKHKSSTWWWLLTWLLCFWQTVHAKPINTHLLPTSLLQLVVPKI